MTIYEVVGPPRVYTEYIDHFVADRYPIYDYYIVEADTKKEAAWAAFKRAKENLDLWFTDLDIDHPLKGIKISVFPADIPPAEDTWYDEALRTWITHTDDTDYSDPRNYVSEKYHVRAKKELLL